MEKSPKVVFPPVGHCIYCGERTPPLTSEHIFPHALGGKIELPDSSCRQCATITSQFEQTVTRGMLGNFRVKFNAPTRRRKQRPKVLPLNVLKGEDVQRIDLEPSKHPGSFVLPVLSLPRLLSGTPNSARHQKMGVWTWPRQMELPALKIAGTDGFRVGTVHIDAFTRFIAKMAHSYTTAARGHQSFVPLLLPLILGQTNDYADFIGGRARKKQPSLDNSDIAFQTLTIEREGIGYVCCEIEIFPDIKGPTYVAVVGLDLADRLVVHRSDAYLQKAGDPLADPDDY